MKKITLITLVSLAALYSCSKEDSCSFTKSTFENKTYKLNYIKIDSNGIDVTNNWNNQTDSCISEYRWRTTFNSDGTFRTYQIPVASCTTQNIVGVWDLKVLNGKNIMRTNSNETIVEEFDCNSISFSYSDTTGQSIIKSLYKYVKI